MTFVIGAWVIINRAQKEKSLDAFLDFMLGKGVIDSAELETFRSITQTRRMFGIVALRESFITPDQLQSILEEQTNGSSEVRLGDLMIDKGFLTIEQVGRILEIQKDSGNLPPDIILDTGILPREILAEELEEFLKT